MTRKRRRNVPWTYLHPEELRGKQIMDAVRRSARLVRVGDQAYVARCLSTSDRKPTYDTEGKARQAAEALRYINPDQQPYHAYAHTIEGDRHYHLSSSSKPYYEE